MKVLQFFLIGICGLSITFLGACNSGNQSASNPPSSAISTTTSRTAESHSKVSKGGQVIESGPYHLEFLPIKEDGGTHLDFYLQKGDTHAAISNAKVTAQVQLPDGTKKSLDLKYDPDGKHYTVLFPGSAVGEYKVVILSNVNGEKVNGRFSFKQ